MINKIVRYPYLQEENTIIGMKKVIKRIVYILVSLVAVILITGLILAYLPTQAKIKNHGITPAETEEVTNDYHTT